MSRQKTVDKRQKTVERRQNIITLSSFVLIILCSLFLFTTCKSSKVATSSPQIAMQTATKEERVKTLLDYEMQYNTLSASVTFEIIVNGKSNSLGGQLRIIKDECIQLSLKMPVLGSELFRVQITPERIIVIDRHNKRCVDEPMSNLMKGKSIDFNYHNLEALFTNRLFMPGEEDIAANYEKYYLSEYEYHIALSYLGNESILYLFQSDYTNRIQSATLNKLDAKASAIWVYSDFKPASNRQLFPMKEIILLDIGNQRYEASLTFKSVDVDTSFSIDYKLPSKYTRMSLEEFMENL